MSEPRETPFECVDPAVGAQLWRLEQGDADPQLRATLEAHLSVCHACRLLVRLDETAHDVGRRGLLRAVATRAGAPTVRWGRAREAWMPALALAASLVLVLTLPPRSVLGPGTMRGVDIVRFVRPVEGEVVAAPRVQLRWTPVPGATRYHVELRDAAGRAVWQGESAEPAVEISERGTLAPGQEYRALLTVQPADLLPPGAPSVRFRAGSPPAAFAHRLRWANPAVQAAMALSLAWLTWSMSRRRVS